MCARADWSQLPDNVIQEISAAVNAVNDLGSSRLVCQGWRAGFSTTVRTATVHVSAHPAQLQAELEPKFAAFKDINHLIVRLAGPLASPQASFDAVIAAASAVPITHLTVAPASKQRGTAHDAYVGCSLAPLTQLLHLRCLTVEGSWSATHLSEIAAVSSLEQLTLLGLVALPDICHLAPLMQLTRLDVAELPQQGQMPQPLGSDEGASMVRLLQPLSTLQRLQHIGVTAATPLVPPSFAAAVQAVLPGVAVAEWTGTEPPFELTQYRSTPAAPAPASFELTKARWIKSCGGAMLPEECSGAFFVPEDSKADALHDPTAALAACLQSQSLTGLRTLQLSTRSRSYSRETCTVKFRALMDLKQMHYLSLVQSSYSKPDVSPLALLAELPHITAFQYSLDTVKAADLAAVFHTGITRLELTAYDWRDQGVAPHDIFAGLPSLRHLRLTGGGCTLAMAALPSSVVTLQLSDFKWRPHDEPEDPRKRRWLPRGDRDLPVPVPAPNPPGHLPNLARLLLDRCDMDASQAFGELPKLRELELANPKGIWAASDIARCCGGVTSLKVGAELLHDVPRDWWGRVEPSDRYTAKQDAWPEVTAARELAEPLRLGRHMQQNFVQLAARLPHLRRFEITGLPPHAAACMGPALAALAPLQELRHLRVGSSVALSDDSYSAMAALTHLTSLQLPYTPALDELLSAVPGLAALRRMSLVMSADDTRGTKRTQQRALDQLARARSEMIRVLPTACVSIEMGDELVV